MITLVVQQNEVIRQFQACLFFLRKDFARTKTQANINQQNKIKQTLNNKGDNFSRAQNSKGIKVASFAF